MTRSKTGMLAGAALAGLLGGTGVTAHVSKLKPELRSAFAQQNPTNPPQDENKPTKVKEKHVCKGQNTCKGQGGCKSSDNGCKGKNSCKGKGGCATDKPMAPPK
jgi:hypothetical protein